MPSPYRSYTFFAMAALASTSCLHHQLQACAENAVICLHDFVMLAGIGDLRDGAIVVLELGNNF